VAAAAVAGSQLGGDAGAARFFEWISLATRTMHWLRFNWQKLFSYGEVICFLSAWGVALLMAVSSQHSFDERNAARNFVIRDNVTGIQATLRR
jgi:hypothetical protein